MAVAGIDIGSTGSKCCVYSEEGKLLSEAFVEYRAEINDGRFELDAKRVWNCVKQAVKQAVAQVSDVRAIGITSFGESFVLLDKNESPLFPLMLYSDKRGTEESLELQRQFGAQAFGKIAGVMPSLMMSASKLMWIRKHCPELFYKTKYILFGADYIVHKLCGAYVTDYTLAARTAMFDVHNLVWWDEVLEFVGITKEQLPTPLPTGSVAGKILDSVSKELGLSSDTLILTGCHDQAAAAIGTGILKQGQAIDSVGTLECITCLCDGCPDYHSIYKGGYSIVPYVIPGTYITYAFSLTGGAMLHWCRENIGKQEQELALKEGCSFYEYMDRRILDKPTDLLVLPHFSGAATPYMDSHSKGAIIGLTTETSLEEIYCAMLEGSSYEMRYNLERLAVGGITVKELWASGGGSQSAAWLQIKADILNVPIVSRGDYRAEGIGCAMLAGVAVKAYKDLQESANVFIHAGQVFYPRKEMYEQYDEIYDRYRNLYQAVKMVL